MMKTEWKIHLIENPNTTNQSVYIFRTIPGTFKIETLNFDKDGSVTLNTVEDAQGTLPENPTFTLPFTEMQEVINAFIMYAKNKGFRMSDEAKIAGKLEATQAHLEDMRTLVFKSTRK